MNSLKEKSTNTKPKTSPCTIMSWNVNGIRAAIKKGLTEWVNDTKPDILCLQEVRALADQVDLKISDYHLHWNPAQKLGYSGTAIFSRIKPISIVAGMALTEHDGEGRVLTAEFPDWFLVVVYTPNSQRELVRLSYRQEWDRAFLSFLKDLEKIKPVIVTGDFNVAHTEIDLANPKSNRRNAGFTDEERSGFQNYIAHGFIDSFREFEKGPGHYTWWTQRSNARERNIGWRIDYFLISQALRPTLKKAWICKEVMGSDHAPIAIEIG